MAEARFVHFVLLDKKVDHSSFYLNEDGTKDLERKLDFTNSRGVLNPYFIIDKEGVRQYKQFIQGCKIYDPVEQEKQKIKATSLNSVVEFVKGAPISLDEVKGKVLIDWLRGHPLNKSSENHNPDEHEALFMEFDPKKQVQAEADKADQEDEAMIILASLRKNPERMRSVSLLFKETANLSDDNEIYLGLRKVAREEPKRLIESVANRENEVLADVLKGLNLGILEKDAKGFVFQEDGAVIMECTIKKQADANSMLVIFLMSAEGEIFYKQLTVKIKQKEIALEAEEK